MSTFKVVYPAQPSPGPLQKNRQREGERERERDSEISHVVTTYTDIYPSFGLLHYLT